MKSPLLVTIIINLASIAFAQVRQDSLLQRIGRTSEFANIDSLEQKLALIQFNMQIPSSILLTVKPMALKRPIKM